MTREQKIDQLVTVMKQRSADVRAEVLVNHLVENGLSLSDYVVKQNGFFYREYVKDIFAASVIERDWYQSYLELQLSRSGFYDMLPEALFHQPETGDFRQRAGVAEMISRYKKNIEKEKGIRRFFQPFENEFFHQRLVLEKEEVDLLDALKSKVLNAWFLKFWGLPSTFTVHEGASFLLLFPYATVIKGNLPLMQSCLKFLLNEEVQIVRKAPEATIVEEVEHAGLGSQPLGDYLVCGSEFMEDDLFLTYKIGPLKNSKVSDFIESGEKAFLLKTFNNYFAPFEADISIDIEIDNKTKRMSFEEGDEIILGYSTVI